MQNASNRDSATGEVVNFDDAMLDACPADLKSDLLAEAAMLLQAFAPERRAEQVTAMIQTLSSGLRGGKAIDRIRARRLAAALRQVASREVG